MKTLQPPLAQAGRTRLWKADGERGNRHQRGYGSTWDKLRRDVLQRDCGLCVPCKARGHVTTATQVDHITPKADGGTDDLSNLQAICRECHDAKTRGEMNRGGRG